MEFAIRDINVRTTTVRGNPVENSVHVFITPTVDRAFPLKSGPYLISLGVCQIATQISVKNIKKYNFATIKCIHFILYFTASGDQNLHGFST